MNKQKKAAEILVECGYAYCHRECRDDKYEGQYKINKLTNKSWYVVEPFSDTLEGRRQADAIEQYLYDHRYNLWSRSLGDESNATTQHQWRLDRIKWCLNNA